MLLPGYRWMMKEGGRVGAGACYGGRGRRSCLPAWLQSNVMLMDGHCEESVQVPMKHAIRLTLRYQYSASSASSPSAPPNILE
jgi:hypothetical protein